MVLNLLHFFFLSYFQYLYDFSKCPDTPLDLISTYLISSLDSSGVIDLPMNCAGLMLSDSMLVFPDCKSIWSDLLMFNFEGNIGSTSWESGSVGVNFNLQ